MTCWYSKIEDAQNTVWAVDFAPILANLTWIQAKLKLAMQLLAATTRIMVLW